MTQPNENETTRTNEPCIEVEVDYNFAKVRVDGSPSVTMVCIEGVGAGNVHLIYHDGKLQKMTVFNGKVTKKTTTNKYGSHVNLKFEGDF